MSSFYLFAVCPAYLILVYTCLQSCWAPTKITI